MNPLEGSNPSPSASRVSREQVSPMPNSAGTADALLALGAATLGESGARPMRDRIRAAWPGARIAAPVYPVRCSTGDNLAVHVAVARAPRGSALVVDVGALRELGYWGEVLTTAAEARGVSGLVIDGGVRDVTALEAHGFPAFTTTVALRGATKERPGTIGRAVRVGDADGVVVVPGSALDAVLAAGRARVDKEDGFFARLREGATTLDLLGLDSSLVEGA